MTSFREKAREIREHGAEERSNFTPSGVPLRMFNYWLKHSDGTKALRIKAGTQKENFCHYWRVVLIWAPLWFVGRTITHVADKYLATKVGIAAVIALYLGLAVFFVVTGNVVGGSIMVLVPYAFLGIAAGCVVAFEQNYNKRWKYVALAAPTSGLVLGGNWVKNHWNHKWDEFVAKFIVGVLITIAVGVFGVGVYTLILSLGIWKFLLLMLGIVAALAVGFGIIWTIVTTIEGLRNRNRQRWYALVEEYQERGEEIPVNFKQRHSRWRRFWTGVGDFFVLIAQVVRVKKWKICPIVEVDTTQEA